jgi:segregation and condensation protein A
MRFRVQLDMFRGPLDLLLYLVRKHELDVIDIPIAEVTEQYLSYMAVLEQIDVDAVGDFLETASILIEIKSRMVLPGDDEVEQELEDPRQELVRRLLAFKKYRDAAGMLEERGRLWRERFPRLAIDSPATQAPRESLGEIELWDLVSAFGRVLKSHRAETGPEKIRYDETPIHIYMQRIDARLRRDGRTAFTDLFEAAVHKSALVGMFLALLELVRHQHARADQATIFGEIWIEPGAEPLSDAPGIVSDYEHSAPQRKSAA